MRQCREATYEADEDIKFRIFVDILDEDYQAEDDDEEDESFSIPEDFEVTIIEAAPVYIGTKKKIFFSDLNEELQDEIQEFIEGLDLSDLLEFPIYKFEDADAVSS